MSDRAGLSRAELMLLADAPLAAAAAVALADAGHGEEEAEAIISGWRAAAASFNHSRLIRLLATDFDPEAREGSAAGAGPAGPEQIHAEALGLCRRAIALLSEVAPDEIPAYQGFVLRIAKGVAEAAGGGLFGGPRVSPAEHDALREIGAALSYQA